MTCALLGVNRCRTAALDGMCALSMWVMGAIGLMAKSAHNNA